MSALPVAIAVAPNGGRRTRAEHPALPLTSGQVAAEAAAALAAGAALLHLHVRDADGRHLLDAGAYRDATRAVRGAVGDALVVQISTEAIGRYSPAEQEALVRALRPEAASLGLRELAPDAAGLGRLSDLLAWCRREAVLAQLIVHDAGDAARLAAAVAAGDLPADVPVLVVLGAYGGAAGVPGAHVPFLATLGPGRGPTMACAFGSSEQACVLAAADDGCDVRVGLENNLELPDGRRAPSSAALVASAAAALHATGHALADADALRRRWGA